MLLRHFLKTVKGEECQMRKDPYDYDAKPKHFDFDLFPLDNQIDQITDNYHKNDSKEGDVVLADNHDWDEKAQVYLIEISIQGSLIILSPFDLLKVLFL